MASPSACGLHGSRQFGLFVGGGFQLLIQCVTQDHQLVDLGDDAVLFEIAHSTPWPGGVFHFTNFIRRVWNVAPVHWQQVNVIKPMHTCNCEYSR